MTNYALIGIGNILLGDDGVGVNVISTALAGNHFAEDKVELVDGGTAVLDLLPYFCNCQKIVVVDAIRAGGKPGNLYRFKADEIGKIKREQLSLHGVQVYDVLQMARQLGAVPEVVVLGVEPERIELGIGLSETVARVVPLLIESAQQELAQRKESVACLEEWGYRN